MNGARAGCCCRSRHMARGPSSVAVAAQWRRLKAAEVHGARAEFCCRSRYMALGPSSVAVAAQWGR